MPRFVILEHDWPHYHCDLMIETGAALRTWRIAKPPIIGQTVDAEPIGDHRLDYLTYEGAVSGGRGRVTRYDSGEYLLLNDDAEFVYLQLQGQRLNGVITLICHAKE